MFLLLPNNCSRSFLVKTSIKTFCLKLRSRCVESSELIISSSTSKNLSLVLSGKSGA